MSVDYKRLKDRLATELAAKSREDKYNETQNILFRHACTASSTSSDSCCEGLDSDLNQRFSRFITDCTIPKINVCIVDTNFKTVLPPSHPADEIPAYLISDLLPCCLEGRTICPEFELEHQDEPKPLDGMFLHGDQDIKIGILKLGIDYEWEQACCDSKKSDYDYVRFIPDMDLDFECTMDPIEHTDRYEKEFDLTHEHVTLGVTTESKLDLCKNELEVKPKIDIVTINTQEPGVYEWEASDSKNLKGCEIKVKVGNVVTVDWPNDSVSYEPYVNIDVDCESVVSEKEEVESTLQLCTVDWLKATLGASPVLEGDGSIIPNLSLDLSVDGGYTGSIPVITNIIRGEDTYYFCYKTLIYDKGILCQIEEGDCVPIEIGGGQILQLIINILNNNPVVQNQILNLVQNNFGDIMNCDDICSCHCCCSDSSSSTSSSSSSSSEPCECSIVLNKSISKRITVPTGTRTAFVYICKYTSTVAAKIRIIPVVDKKGAIISYETYADIIIPKGTVLTISKCDRTKEIVKKFKEGITHLTLHYKQFDEWGEVPVTLDEPLDVVLDGCSDSSSSSQSSSSSSASSSSSSSSSACLDRCLCTITNGGVGKLTNVRTGSVGVKIELPGLGQIPAALTTEEDALGNSYINVLILANTKFVCSGCSTELKNARKALAETGISTVKLTYKTVDEELITVDLPMQDGSHNIAISFSGEDCFNE